MDYEIDLRRFDGEINTNVTTDSDLSDEMRTFYSDYLIDNASPKLVHDQFGQKQNIPKNGGKTIQFRKYSPLPKALNTLTEGVTPVGRKLSVSDVTQDVSQYGDYIELSDMLLLTAVDNNLVQSTKLLGSQAGATIDTIVREEINGGTNVQYAANQVNARHLLVGGSNTESENCYISVDAIKRAARYLRSMNAEPISGSYVAIIHPDIAYDLMKDSEWIAASEYAGSGNLFEGEIGKISGVRFVETTEAKIFTAENLTAAARNLTVRTAVSASTTTLAVKQAITSAEATALAGRKIILGGAINEIVSAVSGAANACSLTLKTAITSASVNDVVYPGEAGASGRNVYSTLVLGDNAFGTTEIEGGGLRHITKQLGSAGSGDPLDQRATVGWKATKAAKRLVEEYMVRIETTSSI